MEAILLELEQERKPQVVSEEEKLTLSNATGALVSFLQSLVEDARLKQKQQEDDEAKKAGYPDCDDMINSDWILRQCQGLGSDILALLTPEQLVHAVWDAAQKPTEAEQQAALFDVLGSSESGMALMFEAIAPNLSRIRRIPRRQLPLLTTLSQADSMFPTYQDPEEERRRLLVEQAKEAAQIAAVAQAKVDLMESQSGAGTTHSVSKKSDLQLIKDAKKAHRQAEMALKAAKEAGAILDEAATFMSTNNGDSGYGSGGLIGKIASQDDVRRLQDSLLPAGTREFHAQHGLPKGTEREFGEGYEKVTIPAVKRDASQLHERLRFDDIMDQECAKAFSGTTSLNPMQSTVYEMAFTRRDNMLVCAPTGAGKTNVAMLTLVAHFRDVGLISSDDDDDEDEDILLDTGEKVVYIAPMKALAQEVVEKFSSKLRPSLGLIVRELTGDMQLTRAEAESANVLVTTPEKWDVVTRKSGNDENSLGNQCGLLIIDEVHLLADDRGAVIESVVARLHRLVESRQKQIRIVALSATLPNYADVAQFLQVPPHGLFFFGPEHRPVPLQQCFIGVNPAGKKNRFLREKKMNEVCYDVVTDSLRRGHQVMVFVHSRKGTGDTAAALTELAQQESELDRLFTTKGKEGSAGDAHNRYSERAKKSRNREVSTHFENGFGIHHAGMLRGDRKLTEQMFADGAIRVLCCTATLAWGINLPARTVVIKGTEVFNPEKGGMMDLSILDVQQIFGRAGRPQFDTSGEATLITSYDAMSRYLDKLVRAVPIESNFIKQLPDHLNAEMVGGTVTNVSEAITWLMYTYLHVRMLRNPIAYGISIEQRDSDPQLRNRSRELIMQAAMELNRNKMIRFNLKTGNFGVTNLGRVAAHFYVQSESVAVFNETLDSPQDLTDAKLMHLICCATEFENVRVRQEELSEVDDLMKKACPFPTKEKIHDAAGKSFVLLQTFISRHAIKSFTLISDTNYIASNAGRVARAMFEMCLKQSKAGPAIKLLRIAKSVDKRIWWFQTPLRQFEGELTKNVHAQLESRRERGGGYDQFEFTLSLLDHQTNEVGQLVHAQKMGSKIQNLIRLMPKVNIQCNIQPVTSSVLRFHVTLTPKWKWQNRWHGGAESFWMWVEDGDNNRIYHSEYVIFVRRTHPDSITLDLSIPAFDPLPQQYFIRVVSDSWVGVEMMKPIPFKDIKMPARKTPYTDLLDLTPLPTSALQEPQFEQLFTKYDTFNPIQTQLFHLLYYTDSPVFLGAPTGSGKTTIAELAILRMKRIHPKSICVYIAPLKSLARERLKEWNAKFGQAPLRWRVLELSGDTHHDKRALSRADLLICTPEKWDLISRGWKGTESSEKSNAINGKEFVQRVRLLVIDEIHLLGEERGAVLEAIVSRTRFISKFASGAKVAKGTKEESSSEHHDYTRIIGLSTALANPDDLADWIGIDTEGHGPMARRGLYNFRPSVRPIPMKVHMQGFAGRHYCPRMATMNKPCYAAIRDYSPNKPSLIFVASRRQTRLTAMDIISYAAADDQAKAFLGCTDEYIESVALGVEDESLRHTLTFGIGLHHAGLSSRDRDTVERLYLNGDIRILVATATLAWGVNLPAHFVIVKGTEYYDGKTSRYVDYPLTDVLQMIGRAGRVGFDDKGVALVMVEESKKVFYSKFLYLPFPVESCLEERMCENLNAEVAIGTIGSVVDAVGYLTWTFYARRVKANPSYYGAKSESNDDVEQFLLSVVQHTFSKLKEHGCINSEEPIGNDFAVSPTILGRTASIYYLQYRTPKQMLFGAREARKLIVTALDGAKEGNVGGSVERNKLVPLHVPERVDELSSAWLLYTLANTHEFDELPVRHNEEYFNQDLSEDLMWGVDTSEILVNKKNRNRQQHRSSYHNLDVLANPHTKCFLLLQAYLERSPLPISDYKNDTKTVMDQVPRLVAAMYHVAMNEGDCVSAAGSFDLLTQIARTRQLLSTRSTAEDDPLLLNGVLTVDLLRRMKQNAKSRRRGNVFPSLWQLLHMNDPNEAKRTLQSFLGMTGGQHQNINNRIDRMIKTIYALPCINLENVSVSQTMDKTTGKCKGIVKLELRVKQGSGPKYADKRDNTNNHDTLTRGGNTLLVLVGTKQRHLLLAQKSLAVNSSSFEQHKSSLILELDFDFQLANAHGGEERGSILLRLLFEDVRGLDSEVEVSL